MKKFMKKISALLITMVVLAAMAIPASAATITINNADGAEKHMVQVIEADPTSATGWKFASDHAQEKFTAALGVTDPQEAIAMLVKKANASAVLPSAYSSVNAATDAQIDTALSNMSITGEFTTEVSAAGLYAIRAKESGYTYKDMAVYVDFAGTTTPSPLEAKKESTEITKGVATDYALDHAVAIGDEVAYGITSSFPYIPANRENKTYTITDTIRGASYIEDTVQIMIGSEIIDDVTAVFSGSSFTVDLSQYITTDNANAGKQVFITYIATVTDTTVNNKVSHTDGDFTGDDETEIYTGTITLTKNDEDGKVLPGAGFNVYKDNGTAALKFVQDKDADGNVVEGKYTYAPNANDAVTEVVTAADGTLEVKGLDLGKYHFTEITAPDGYSINENGADAELTLGKDADGNAIRVATAVFTSETSLSDTKLSALPSTGSIGTYLFTIIGVGVMAVMVSLFTIKRRRDA